ncbi:MAG: hypothetical protein EOM25_00025 [Deltaproteobacteria bacterium]|nr:hypothetical protein [Deltaproteobacteria bacterium]
MKYIVFEDFSGQELPVLFPDRIGHGEMRAQIPYSKIISAGFVEINKSRISCSGGSKSLGVEFRPEDSETIATHLEPS